MSNKVYNHDLDTNGIFPEAKVRSSNLYHSWHFPNHGPDTNGFFPEVKVHSSNLYHSWHFPKSIILTLLLQSFTRVFQKMHLLYFGTLLPNVAQRTSHRHV